jgi:Lipase (class 3)
MAYDVEIAQTMITLGAIVNAGIGEPLAAIETKIKAELKNASYATRGMWSLVWGPVIGGKHDNLICVVKRQGEATSAIVLRGTDMKNFQSILEDIPVSQSAYPFSEGAITHVSTSFLEAVEAMIDTPAAGGLKLGDFLDGITRTTTNVKLFVAGHSQGGGLAPIMLGWVLQRAQTWPSKAEVAITCYASAPPTSGDPAFARWISSKATSYQIVNPFDIVPFWYGAIRDILADNIPKALGHTLKDDALRYLTNCWADIADHAGQWSQPATVIRLGSVQLPITISWILQAQNQHAHNSYLYLLGASPVNCVPATLLPRYGPPHSETGTGSSPSHASSKTSGQP